MLNNLYELYQDLKLDGIIFCFSGPASQSVVEGIGHALKRKMELEEAGQTTVQRIFSIFVEQMQNIVHYSIERTPADAAHNGLSHGVVVVGQEDGAFFVICGNKVRASQSKKMLRHLDYLSTLSKEELKAYYKKMRKQESGSESKGAGLGFVEMFRRACEPLEYHVAPIDNDTVFFSVKAKG